MCSFSEKSFTGIAGDVSTFIGAKIRCMSVSVSAIDCRACVIRSSLVVVSREKDQESPTQALPKVVGRFSKRGISDNSGIDMAFILVFASMGFVRLSIRWNQWNTLTHKSPLFYRDGGF